MGVGRKKAKARGGEEPKDVRREERGLGDSFVGDGGGARTYTPLAQPGLVVCCHEGRHRWVCRCSRAREHRRLRRRRAIVEQERRASVLVEDSGGSVQGKATCDERDGALGTVRASVLCRVPNLSCRGACAGSIWVSRLPHRDMPSGEPSEGPRRVNDAGVGGCSGCQPSFQSWQVEGRAESTRFWPPWRRKSCSTKSGMAKPTAEIGRARSSGAVPLSPVSSIGSVASTARTTRTTSRQRCTWVRRA